MNEIRTYMPFSFPEDPAKIQTIPDMDLSYALASTLVEWDSEKQISAGLAESWKIITPNIYRFIIRKGARWSNGKPITAAEVKLSFERSMKAYPIDLRSLIQMLESIECHSNDEVDFKLKVPAQHSGLLGKLTEPNYGILRVTDLGKIDLSITTGPFFQMAESNSSQLILLHNPEWHRFDAESPTPERVVIRRPSLELDTQTVLFSDSWPNLIETSSIISSDLLKRYETERFAVWKRPLDKFFHIQLGKRSANAEGRALIRFLRQHTRIEDYVAGLSGLTPTAQFFPRGYQLYDPQFSYRGDKEIKLPEHFRHNPIEILISPARVTPALKENIRRVIFSAVGIEPHFISLPLQEFYQYKLKGRFDLYAGTVGLADPDPEGVMSYYLEGDAPIIYPMGNDFLKRLDTARREKDTEKRLSQMRAILSDAIHEGDILPLFHLSTLGIGRSELDFEGIPSSDESVTLSKIRFHGLSQSQDNQPAASKNK